MLICYLLREECSLLPQIPYQMIWWTLLSRPGLRVTSHESPEAISAKLGPVPIGKTPTANGTAQSSLRSPPENPARRIASAPRFITSPSLAAASRPPRGPPKPRGQGQGAACHRGLVDWRRPPGPPARVCKDRCPVVNRARGGEEGKWRRPPAGSGRPTASQPGDSKNAAGPAARRPLARGGRCRYGEGWRRRRRRRRQLGSKPQEGESESLESERD